MTKSLNLLRETLSLQNQKQINDILLSVGKFKSEIDAILEPYRASLPSLLEPFQRLELIFSKFHLVAKTIQERKRAGKQPFKVEDEYDVQDLLHGLLKIFFNDIEPEEYCPSYCGTSPRIDFFLRKEKIFVEAKIASKTHRRKRISQELIIDKEYYRKKENLKALFCIVYDPNGNIENPRGFELDLGEKAEAFEVRVYVVPNFH